MGCWLCFGPRKEQQKMQNQEVKDLSDLKCKDQLSSEEPSEPDNTAHDSQNQAQTFTYRELATATNNFRRESLIGQGGFGAVYMGKLDTTDQTVAVKQLDHGGLQGEKEFLVEVLMLSLLRHENLVNLFGYCAEGDQRLLVYEYLPLGSLENHLHDLRPDHEPLSWSTRMMIAAGAARGLEYLHNQADPPVIYRDLKTANILLDRGYQPKLSDFGLAKFGPTGDISHISTRVMGTQGYCAPEYADSGKLTMKSDIYSFGVVLLELITGRRPVDGTFGGTKRCLIDWARPLYKDQKNVMQLADPAMGSSVSQSSLMKALQVAFICLQQDANSRPAIGDIVLALDYIVSRNCKNKEIKTEQMEEEAEALQFPKEETTMEILNSEGVDRDKAVAEAKMWGETWRDIRRQNAE